MATTRFGSSSGVADGVKGRSDYRPAGAPGVSLAAFEGVALPHLRHVYRAARRLGRDETEAEELTQETFMRALRGFGNFRPTDSGAKPWLLKILHNTFFTRRQRQRREPVLLENMDLIAEKDGSGDQATTQGASVDWDRCDEEMKRAVNALPPRQREVMLMWALGGLKYREIAETCGCPLGTVMSTLHRARRILASRLNRYYSPRRPLAARCA